MRMRVSLDGYVSRFFAVLALGPLVPMVAGCGSSTTGGGTLSCDGATPLEAAGQDSGYEKCDGQWLHRPEVVQCGSLLPRATTCDVEVAGGSCSQDSDCTEQPNGWCSSGDFDGGCYCNYGCTQDSDCGADSICLCDSPVGRCVKASCKSDADCGEGALCATYITEPGCGGFAFACQSPLDECGGDGDCPSNSQCALVGDHRECEEIQCVIGRPFLVEGEARVADVARRGDWCARGVAPRAAELGADVRRVLAEEWSRCGQMEHASIAAFARFSMQLLALGAPPDLLVATHAAMADETDHALACFALASAYAGAEVGPGRLAMEGALADHDMETVVRLAIREGCVGETVAAVEAAEAARHAEDPAVRGVLAKIAEDETRHAELAWRFVGWALSGVPEMAGVVESELAAVLAEERGRAVVAASGEDAAWLAHGVARGTAKAELRRRVVEGVVAPSARALVQRGAAASATVDRGRLTATVDG